MLSVSTLIAIKELNMDNETKKDTKAPVKKRRVAKKPQEANGIIVMYKFSNNINHIEVDNIDQAKAIQATLNDWAGSHALTKFIYL